MHKQHILIADDEIPARRLLKEYLLDYPFMQVVAECKNGIEAVNMINGLQPDIVFLDIQMPGKTGFEVLQQVDVIPRIIFSTAFDQYALQAFEVNAMDYLLKPYTKERFQLTVNKLLQYGSDSVEKIRSLTDYLAVKTYPERILVEQGNKLANIAVNDILYLQAEGDYVKIFRQQDGFLSNKGISEWEQKLDPRLFLRIHRSYIISLQAIGEVRKEPTGPQVVLRNGIVLKVSRTYIEAFKKFIY